MNHGRTPERDKDVPGGSVAQGPEAGRPCNASPASGPTPVSVFAGVELHTSSDVHRLLTALYEEAHR